MTHSSGGDTGGSSAGMGVFREVSESSTTSTPPSQQSQSSQSPPVTPTQTTQPTQSTEPAQSQQSSQQTSPPLTAEAIAEAIARTQQRQQQTQQQPQYTEAQFKKDFGIVEIDKPMMDAMFGIDSQPEQVDAMNMLVKQIVGMSLKMADYRMQQALQKHLEPINQQLTPLQQKYQEYQNAQFTNTFYSKYGHLKNFDSIVKTIVQQMQSSGQKFQTADQAMQAIAQQTENMLRNAGIAINPQQPQQPVANQQRPQGPARVSTGGGVGTTPAASSTSESKGMAIFR